MRILKITSLPPTKDSWVDRDMIMLHSCFQLLVDFVEKEDGLNQSDYEFYKETVDELKYLYDWWQENKESVSIDDDVADKHLIRLINKRGFLWT